MPLARPVRGLRSLATAIGVAACALGTAACGPSLRVVHESTVYFERCHAAELEDQIPLESKTECWERWLRWYSATQTGTRVLYARERLVYLAQGELVDPLAVGQSAAAETATDPTNTSGSEPPPAPTRNPDESLTSGGSTASPPVTDGRDAPPSPAIPRGERPLNPRRSGHSVCEPVCRPRWEACASACDRTERSCVGACQTEYGACMDGCI